MRNVVAIDIDNTVHESDITMNRVSMELFNSPFRWCKQDEWYRGGHQHMPMEHALQIFDRMHDRDMIFMTDPYVGSREGLARIANLGYEIHYYTDRKKSAGQATSDWLAHHGLPFAENVICCQDKRASLSEARDSLATVVDDRVRTLIFARYELGLPVVFSLRHPYNRNLSDVPGVLLHDTWTDLAASFEVEVGVASPDPVVL